MKNKKAIVLLSGGLDSVVSLASVKDNYRKILALTFNYGQKSSKMEVEVSREIADFYSLEHIVIKLDWLGEISKSSLNKDIELPYISSKDLDNKAVSKESAKAVWVPNRNALFINIAACIAESNDYSDIIIGANSEEAATFKDNSKEFINSINLSLKNSTQNEVQVIAPLIDMNKEEIVKAGLKFNIPFEHIFSCYSSNKKHCGECESCLRLKRALQLNGRDDIIKKIF